MLQSLYINLHKRQNMKKSNLHLLILLLVCTISLSSCLSNDDNSNWSTFNGVSVTVTGNNLSGYKLYTDHDAILIPTTESLSQVAWLKEVKRAVISFSLTEEYESNTQLETGKTYHIELNASQGMNQQIPTFIVNVDTLSEEYQTAGKDSITLKNKTISAFDKNAQFYVKNGYMNVSATFDYSPYKTVSFLLYYDGTEDMSGNKLSLNLFFNNNIDTPYGAITSNLCFKMPEEAYDKYMLHFPSENDSIDVYLNAETQKGKEQMHCKMAIRDFIEP